jgi:orotidine-5'-phosphate decarboxylase
MSEPANPVFCAIDTDDLERAEALGRAVAGAAGGIKLGKEFFTAHGPQGVRRVQAAAGLPLFLDLKWHDIPNTVAGAVAAARDEGVAMATVHTLGGSRMLEAAAGAAGPDLALVGVTVLTSHSPEEFGRTLGRPAPDLLSEVVRLAGDARAAGLQGVVCSPQEIGAVRRTLGPDALVVVPGIRRADDPKGDQTRTATPAAAARAGATHLVVGRPVLAAGDPAAAFAAMMGEMDR